MRTEALLLFVYGQEGFDLLTQKPSEEEGNCSSIIPQTLINSLNTSLGPAWDRHCFGH